MRVFFITTSFILVFTIHPPRIYGGIANKGKYTIGFELQDYFLWGGGCRYKCSVFGCIEDGYYFNISPQFPVAFLPNLSLGYNIGDNFFIRLTGTFLLIFPEGDVVFFLPSGDLSLGYLIKNIFEASVGIAYLYKRMCPNLLSWWETVRAWGIKIRTDFLIFTYREKIAFYFGWGTTTFFPDDGTWGWGTHFNLRLQYQF